ncbi:Uncharacterised protein [Chlamydia abortus]|nr:Uncharacterised protein [Chlamydia abortus]
MFIEYLRDKNSFNIMRKTKQNGKWPFFTRRLVCVHYKRKIKRSCRVHNFQSMSWLIPYYQKEVTCKCSLWLFKTLELFLS